MSGDRFSLRIEYQTGECYDEAELIIRFDQASREAFFRWMADGQALPLGISKDGMTYITRNTSQATPDK